MDSKVQGTNDFSSASKLSIVNQGYYDDKFLKHFVSVQARRAPIINLGYYVRSIVIDWALRYFLNTVGMEDAQVISCGAGFDTTYFRLFSNSNIQNNVIYYEVDFPDVVQRKSKCILNSQELLMKLDTLEELCPSHVSVSSAHYRLIGCDLRNLDMLKEILMSLSVDFSSPTLFLSECAITYMEEIYSSQLIEWAAINFHNSLFLNYEQVFPFDGFGYIMTQHFNKILSPLKSLPYYSTLEDQENRFKQKGWTKCFSQLVYDIFYKATSLSERMNAFKVEPFDEFEEWHQKCSHYSLTVASKGSLIEFPVRLFNSFSDQHKKWKQHIPVHNVRHTVYNITGSKVERFSCACVFIPEQNKIYLVGGFGTTEKSQHVRLKDVAEISVFVENNEVKDLSCKRLHDVDFKGNTKTICLDALHHSCTVLKSKHNKIHILLYGGRYSPEKPVNGMPVLLTINESSSNDGILAQEFSCDKEEFPNPRWKHTAQLVPKENFCSSDDSNQIIIFGGRTSKMLVLGDMWILTLFIHNLTSNFKKVSFSGTMPCARFSHSAAFVTNDQMYITGGLNKDLDIMDDVWCYSVSKQFWNKFEIEGPSMLPRYGHTSHGLNENLLLVGGVNTLPGCQPGIAVINTKTRICIEYALNLSQPEYPLMLHNHCSILMDEGMLLVIAGGGNCFSFGTHFNANAVGFMINQQMSFES